MCIDPCFELVEFLPPGVGCLSFASRKQGMQKILEAVWGEQAVDVFAVENVQVVRSFIVKKVACARASAVAAKTPVSVSTILRG